MVTKKVLRYYAQCGQGFWKKQKCLQHERVCKCWTNPKYKTCKTCKFGELVYDSNGMEREPQFLEEWRQWECSNPEMIDDFFTPAHETAPDLCINCPVWDERKSS